MTAIAATFVKVIPVAGRKQVQIVLEAPIEKANEILSTLGGYPDPSNPVWVGVARIRGEVVVANKEPLPSDTVEDKKPNLVQQAAIIADKLEWNDYVRAAFPNMIERGAEAMRKILNVQSRKELATDEEAAKRFMTLLQRFKDYQNYGVA